MGLLDKVDELRDLVARGEVFVLTGAGISTDSGIPDYRGPDGKLRHTSPMTYQQFIGSEGARQRYWARSHIGWLRVDHAKPNDNHRAVAELERAGLLAGIATQNVDGLHQAAGASDVIDLHGRLDRVICLDCGTRRPRREIGWRLDAVNPGFTDQVLAADGALRPDGDIIIDDELVQTFRTVNCRQCEGPLKPDVVFFGEHVPADRFRRALRLVAESAALLVLGSSLAVGSGFRFVTAARKLGIPVAIVTLGTTRGDRYADIKLNRALGDVLGLVGPSALPVRETQMPDHHTRQH